MFMFNGCGTTLYGRARPPGLEGYIATKFFCLMWAPLVPIKSYVVVQEEGWDVGILADKKYKLVPLEKIWPAHFKRWLWGMVSWRL